MFSRSGFGRDRDAMDILPKHTSQIRDRQSQRASKMSSNVAFAVSKHTKATDEDQKASEFWQIRPT